MTMNYPLADMLTRIRNGQKAGKKVVTCHTSNLQASVCKVLQDMGYIRGYAEKQVSPSKKELHIELKYDGVQPVIRELHCVSKPGRRVYTNVSAMPRFYNGLGVTIVSTPRGVMADQQARDANVGGEVLCQVF